jgi:DNA polymerase
MMSDCGLRSNPESECALCPALVESRSLIVFPTPCPAGGLLAIGEAPGADEDRIGEGFVGRAGRTLDALLGQHGMRRGRDYGVANIVRCRPEGNRKPAKGEIERCLPKLARFLSETRPRVLLLVGLSAVSVFLGPGSLHRHIERSRSSPLLLAEDAHEALKGAIRTLHEANNGLFAVPMPHTSGMAWHRQAPDGRRWREIGVEQVALAVSFLEEGVSDDAA